MATGRECVSLVNEAVLSCGGRVMKRFMLIAAVIVCFSTMANAVPVRIEFSGYIQEGDSSPATAAFFGISPGDEFRLVFTYDPDAAFKIAISTWNNFELGINLYVNTGSGFELVPIGIEDSLPVRSWMYVYDSAMYRRDCVEVWAYSPYAPFHSTLTFNLFEFEPFTVNGDACPEIDWTSFLRGTLYCKVRDFPTWEYHEFRGTITTATIVPEEPPIQVVDIDVKPGSDRNPINLKSKGMVPVALLGADDLDVTCIEDPLAVELFGAELLDTANENHKPAKPIHFVVEDLNWDGYDDILFHFSTQDLAVGLGEGTKEVCLAFTIGEYLFAGTDTVDAFLKGKKKK
jgi:hypothetical protein